MIDFTLLSCRWLGDQEKCIDLVIYHREILVSFQRETDGDAVECNWWLFVTSNDALWAMSSICVFCDVAGRFVYLCKSETKWMYCKQTAVAKKNYPLVLTISPWPNLVMISFFDSHELHCYWRKMCKCRRHKCCSFTHHLGSVLSSGQDLCECDNTAFCCTILFLLQHSKCCCKIWYIWP